MLSQHLKTAIILIMLLAATLLAATNITKVEANFTIPAVGQDYAPELEVVLTDENSKVFPLPPGQYKLEKWAQGNTSMEFPGSQFTLNANYYIQFVYTNNDFDFSAAAIYVNGLSPNNQSNGTMLNFEHGFTLAAITPVTEVALQMVLPQIGSALPHIEFASSPSGSMFIDSKVITGVVADKILENGDVYSYALRVFTNVGYAFDNPTITLNGTPVESSAIITNQSNEIRLQFDFFITEAGESPNNPVKPTDLASFKAAFSSSTIKYIELEKFDVTINQDEPREDVVAQINHPKVLTLKGNNVITSGFNSIIAAIFMVNSKGSLTINGTGTLEFKANVNGSKNAVIWNNDGTVEINSGTLLGNINTAVFGIVVYNTKGSLTVNGGTLKGHNYFSSVASSGTIFADGGEVVINGGGIYL